MQTVYTDEYCLKNYLQMVLNAFKWKKIRLSLMELRSVKIL